MHHRGTKNSFPRLRKRSRGRVEPRAISWGERRAKRGASAELARAQQSRERARGLRRLYCSARAQHQPYLWHPAAMKAPQPIQVRPSIQPQRQYLRPCSSERWAAFGHRPFHRFHRLLLKQIQNKSRLTSSRALSCPRPPLNKSWCSAIRAATVAFCTWVR